MTMEIPFRSLCETGSGAHVLEDSDGSESDDQYIDDERVQYAPRPSQGRKSADATTV
jgi:hypothetical protein